MIIIDSRENSLLAKTIIELCEKQRVQYSKEWLEIGDYVMTANKSVAIEAKSSADFLASIRNKRIFTQASNMVDNYDISIILIYDDINSAINYLNRKENKQYDSIAWKNKLKTMFVGAIGALQVQTNIKVLWVPDLTSAAHCVLATHSHLDGSFQLKKQLPKRTRTDDLRIDMLTQIKGVSPTKAKILLKVHGSIAEISQLKIEQITKIEGIGKILANRILKTLNEEKEVRE